VRQADIASIANRLTSAMARLSARSAGLGARVRRGAATALSLLAGRLDPESLPRERSETMPSTEPLIDDVPEKRDAGTLDREILSALLRMVVPLWRSRRRLEPEADQPGTARIALRHLDQAWSMLESLGVSIRDDFEGSAYDIGNFLVQAIEIEERADCTHETIVEVTEPAIFLREAMLQRSKVLVGRPLAVQPSTASVEADDPRETPVKPEGETSTGSPVRSSGQEAPTASPVRVEQEGAATSEPVAAGSAATEAAEAASPQPEPPQPETVQPEPARPKKATAKTAKARAAKPKASKADPARGEDSDAKPAGRAPKKKAASTRATKSTNDN